VTALVAAVAVETGIAPRDLMEDEVMLNHIVAYMNRRAEQQQKRARRRA